MKPQKLPMCPYCQEKLDFLYALTIKSEGEFHCPKCKNTSDIKYNKDISKYFWAIVSTSFAVLLIWTIFINDYITLGVLLVLAPFIFFYMKVPSLMVLRKPKPVKIKNKKQDKIDDKTKVIKINNEFQRKDKENNRVKINKIEDIPIDKDLYNK